MKKLRIFNLILILTMVVTIFVGCNSDKEETQSDQTAQQEQNVVNQGEDKLEGTVTMSGSTTVLPVAQAIADAFASVEPGITVNVQGGGSSTGIKDANAGTVDIGNASRELKEEEKEWGLTEHVLAYDGIAVVVHPENPVSDLDKETINKIFRGEIKNWKEVGGNDAQIVVLGREAGSGTRGAFEEIVGLLDKNDEGKEVSAMVEDALTFDSNGALKASLSQQKNGIGYLSLGYLDETVKALTINGVEATVENVKAGTYEISRHLLMVTKGEISKEAQAFLDYALGEEGQKIVAEKYIPAK
ncbi:phosphate ABC transporter substrate-binding protein [Defluviitalea phaphyphila]|uniref:phosphate ABC transporter substrate-binding protein n=1 Tax=Defluviitalea phaphyphila TaxID=1473580 RepID=UPI0007314C59|nr:phosphate ABC transporter substrate-binding protein [Defluviitalea phaphyphila]